ncbi:hypothetical protein BOX37_24310 [Nocardia mangyaensis]|uniref:Uncharacterized protein n=1 Tax=Nocardia mangyaensis TaxID=2213200 RepID=A0A1J0VWW6_9NOCA|nr:hypothetical protein [Nocardia mangyaensis]APE36532.1 hypothetical protein BOX37_24310 [Nocardia mangyaensis]
MSGLSRYSLGGSTRLSWLDALPWLGEHRSGPPLLGEGDLLASAWMTTAAGESVPPEHLDEVYRRLATVFVHDHRELPLATAFPYAPDRTTDLDLGDRTDAALRAAGVTELAEFTVARLADLRGVGPASITEIVTALIQRSIETVPANAPALAEFDRLYGELGERDRFLLTARILTDSRTTLAECGTALGISRERVNQLDNRLRDRVHAAFHSSRYLRAAADRLAAAAKPVAVLDRLVAAVPELGAPLGDTGITLWFALAHLDTRFDVVDGWVVAETMDSARGRVRATLTALASDEGLVSIPTIAAELDIPEAEAATWLQYAGYRVLDGHVLVRSTSVHDNIAAVLALAGSPMTIDDIHAAVVPARSLSSVRNAMVSDDRFVKTDRAHWALARWGTSRYVPIHRQIGEALDASGGRIPVEELVARLTGAFDVKEFSVRTYAASGEYMTIDGIVTRRHQTQRARKSPAKTRNLYREGPVLRLRTTIVAPHVKGSAFNLPAALAGLVGAGPNRSVELSSRLGPQSILWVAVQARSGTIKRFIDHLGLTPGDEVFLEFAPEATERPQFDVVPVAPTVRGGALRRVLAATGHSRAAELGDAELAPALAEALWLPADAEIATIATTLRARKEDALAELLTAERD